MGQVRLSIIVASSGRKTLGRTVNATRAQMRDGDELLVSVQTDCPWGHAARNQLMQAARGDAVLFIDDDDCHTPDALDTVRAAVEANPDRMLMFRMRYPDGRTLWETRTVVCGNVSTQMVVVPGGRLLGRWGTIYEGDFQFIQETCHILGEPVWRREVIALIRPHENAS